MDKKKILIFALCAVLLFATAFFGYSYLSQSYIPENNNSLGGALSESETVEPESTQSTTESAPEAPESSEGSSSAEAEDVVMAPDFTVYDAEGNPVKLSDFAGKPVVINFWATWCGYCVGEMPTYQKAFDEYGDEVVFMFINLTDGHSETQEKAMALIDEKGYTFPVYYDLDLEATYVYGAYSLPATGFITPSGIFAGGQMGAMGEEMLFGYIEQLLALE